MGAHGYDGPVYGGNIPQCRKPMTFRLPISRADYATITVPRDLTQHEARTLADILATLGIPGHNPYPPAIRYEFGPDDISRAIARAPNY